MISETFRVSRVFDYPRFPRSTLSRKIETVLYLESRNLDANTFYYLILYIFYSLQFIRDCPWRTTIVIYCGEYIFTLTLGNAIYS